MSQQIRVLQCKECDLYQVDIVKKSNKWDCKVCRQKQVVLREFFRGTGAECRLKVQELNLEHGQKRHAQRQILDAQDVGLDTEVLPAQRTSKWAAFVDKPTEQASRNDSLPSQSVKRPSKWAAYVDESTNQVPKVDRRTNNKLTKGSSKWAAFVDEQEASKMQRKSSVISLDSDEVEFSFAKSRSSGSNKRRSEDNSSANIKPFSKWQKFL
ncbi:MRN complex-interacting protein [Drosophila sulfurigaster albostrigata]|uniref:MRN complex-interacting protein n=1 Tax=Drosophila sulfurigaster albostrigata TaxID=89887 RepID=UPI002D219919|nr:MRN complex-interacting protein [Drosophila sulfurigaster albostrigata]